MTDVEVCKPLVESFSNSAINDAFLPDHITQVFSDEDSARIALYVPFDLLTNAVKVGDTDLINTYKMAWYDLLQVRDVAANFTDGDVPELEYRNGDLPRVVKAAQLMPMLLRAGVIDKVEINALYAQYNDSTFRDSVDTAFGRVIATPTDHTYPVSANRRRWLDEQAAERSAADMARGIAGKIIRSAGVLLAEATPTYYEGIYEAVRLQAGRDFGAARQLLVVYRPQLEARWQTGSDNDRLQLTRIYRRLSSLNIMSLEELADKAITTPRLDGPFSENLQYIAEDVRAIRKIVERVNNDPALQTVLYPAVIIGGSRLKGYGEASSDIDISVLVRPEIAKHRLSDIQALVQDAFKPYGPTVFWLDNTTNGLRVHDFADPDIHTADSSWTHSLFGAAWIGRPDTVTDLQTHMINAYCQAGDPRRGQYLERLEQDALQYRLLHKGYAHHRALRGARPSQVFYDDGYRQVASKLFMRSVQLPKI